MPATMSGMIYRRLADMLVVVHFLVSVFCLAGSLIALWNPWVALVHIPLVIWVCLALLMQWDCPLTPLENRLRIAAGDEGYEGGFLDHYLAFAPNSTRQNGAPICGFLAMVHVIFLLLRFV